MICVCLDSFKPDYLEFAPNIRKIAESSKSGALETIIGYTGISASFFTGYYPEKHGVFGMFNCSLNSNTCGPIAASTAIGWALFHNIRNVVKKDHFFVKPHRIPRIVRQHGNLSVTKYWSESGVLNVPTLFDWLRDAGLNVAVSDWPIRAWGNKCAVTIDRSVEKQLKWLRGVKAEFKYLHLWELDTIAHKHGTRSHQVMECVKGYDNIISVLMEMDSDIVIWSDHGMIDVAGIIDVESILRSLKLSLGRDLVYFIDSTSCRIWAKNDEVERSCRQKLSEVKNGKVLSQDEIAGFRLGKNMSDVFFLADPGYLLLPNYFQGAHPVKAMHGYVPAHPDQKGFYIVSRLKGREDAHIVDIAPTINDLFDLKKKEVHGRSLMRERQKGR